MTFQDSFIIYTSGRTCPWCERAVALLEALNAPFTVEILTLEMAEMIRSISGMTTVPVIRLGEELIGGCTDLEAYIEENGELPHGWE